MSIEAGKKQLNTVEERFRPLHEREFSYCTYTACRPHVYVVGVQRNAYFEKFSSIL